MANEPGLSGEGGEASHDALGPSGSGTILLVEDETNVRILVTTVLKRQGYTVIEASNGSEALERGLEYSLPIHLLITDVTMPLLSGVELVRQILPLRPSMKVIFITGREREDVPQGRGVSFLEKPFTLRGLLAQVEWVMR
jgi:two-component system cell cycle sensor histidine kinase/response regulator CckA